MHGDQLRERKNYHVANTRIGACKCRCSIMLHPPANTRMGIYMAICKDAHGTWGEYTGTYLRIAEVKQFLHTEQHTDYPVLPWPMGHTGQNIGRYSLFFWKQRQGPSSNRVGLTGSRQAQYHETARSPFK